MEQLRIILSRLWHWLKVIYELFQVHLCYEKIKKYYILMILVVIGQFCHAIYPFVFTDVPIINEYWSLPEKTLLTDEAGKSTYVDNTEFINKQQLFGVQHKYDPRIDKGKNVLIPEMTAKIAWTPELQKFVDASERRFFYDKPGGSLVALDYFTDEDKSQLNKIVVDQVEQERLKRLQVTAETLVKELMLRKKTPQELEFIASNVDEWAWQMRGQGINHHRSFIFEPIRDLEYGKPPSEVFCQYGYGMVQFVRWLLKLSIGITYTNYVHIIFSFYIIYLIVMLLLVFTITKRWDFVLCAALYFVGMVESLDFKMLYAYDGMNPIRCFFDIISVYFVYKYSETNGAGGGYLWGAIFGAATFLIYNNSFGLFLYSALLVCLLYKCLFGTGKRRVTTAMICIAIAIGIAAYWLGTPGPDIMSKYFTAGLLTRNVSSDIPALLFFSGVAFLLLLQRSNVQKNVFAVFVLMYWQQMLLFKVVENNTAAVTSAIVYCVTYFVMLALSGRLIKFQTTTLMALVAVLVVNSWYPAILAYYTTKNNYFEIVKAHQFEKLPFREMPIVTDIESSLIIETVGLINRYASGKMITLFSEYDTLLLPAAEKINSLPYSDLISFVFANSENAMIIERLRKSKADFIFVDSSCMSSTAVDVVHDRRLQELVFQTTGVDLRSQIWRAKRKQDFFGLWKAIADDYELVERGRLLSVFKRKGISI
ncbi:MAG: hypothetical protein WCV63_01410 [Negativicutes bacterium]